MVGVVSDHVAVGLVEKWPGRSDLGRVLRSRTEQIVGDAPECVPGVHHDGARGGGSIGLVQRALLFGRCFLLEGCCAGGAGALRGVVGEVRGERLLLGFGHAGGTLTQAEAGARRLGIVRAHGGS